MEELGHANKRLKRARDEVMSDIDALIAELDNKESNLKNRLDELNKKKAELSQASGNVNAADDDLVEINAGGQIVSAKRSTLTQLKNTRMDALFSGRWEQRLQRDREGRIFIDVNPVAFRAIIDHLHELAISSEEDPPSPPCVDNEHNDVLKQQLGMFGVCTVVAKNMPKSNIIKKKEAGCLHKWLEEDGLDGEFSLLYRSSKDGLSPEDFHAKCDNKGPTLTVIKTVEGYVFGGYANTPWGSDDKWAKSSKAFLFALSMVGIASPKKMKLKNPDDKHAVLHSSAYGPVFGGDFDLATSGSTAGVHAGRGCSYEPISSGFIAQTFSMEEVEVFGVDDTTTSPMIPTTKQFVQRQNPPFTPVTKFSDTINDAINRRQETLRQAEAELQYLEHSFEDEQTFIASFASGDAKDVVLMNVSGTRMATKRETLQIAEDSVLAQQFDDTKWTEQGCNAPHVEDWTPNDVASWVRSVKDIPSDVGRLLGEHEINGRELLSFDIEGLERLGVKRLGTQSLLLKEIKALEKASQDVVTFIEHSPYCFGKILDHLRLKRLHSQGLAKEPALPKVSDAQQNRFEKVVKYYFPGDSSNFILG